MIKCYKKEKESHFEIRYINDNGDFKMLTQDSVVGFPFGIPMTTTINKMGYKSIKECCRQLKERNVLGLEVDYNTQRESEKNGLIKLGVERIRRAKRINTNDFKDVCNKLLEYGLNFTDAQNSITETYLYMEENKNEKACL